MSHVSTASGPCGIILLPWSSPERHLFIRSQDPGSSPSSYSFALSQLLFSFLRSSPHTHSYPHPRLLRRYPPQPACAPISETATPVQQSLHHLAYYLGMSSCVLVHRAVSLEQEGWLCCTPASPRSCPSTAVLPLCLDLYLTKLFFFLSSWLNVTVLLFVLYCYFFPLSFLK